MLQSKWVSVALLSGMVMSALPLTAVAAEKSKLSSLSVPATEKAKVDYGLGYDLGKNYHRLGLDVDVEQILQGMRDGYSGSPSRVPVDELGALMARFQSQMKEVQTKALKRWAEENAKAEAEFLQANAKKEGVVSLPSGLQYRILKAGNGPIPKEMDWVSANYNGRLLDGSVFDNSERNGKPTVFLVKDATPGWREALQLMPQGSKWQLFVPSKLGFGERGAGREIGPNAMLIYELELVNANAGVGIPQQSH